jgi:GDP-L-fucose synthase
MDKRSKILITGSGGMVGKNLVEELQNQGYENLIFADKKEINLMNREEVFNFFNENKPEFVFHLASKVGGIKDNSENPVEYLRDNLLLNTNVIDACFKSKIKKTIILNSATIYPPNIEFPVEEDFFSGKLEPENEAYALSKIYAIKLCEYYNKEYNTNFINLVSTNIYGKYSKFDSTSNVIASLLMRFHEAKIRNKKEVIVWGTGKARREFIYAKDLSQLLILSMKNLDKKDCINSILNCGLGDEFFISEIAEKVKKIIKFEGKIIFDFTKLEGVKRRAMNSTRFKKLIKFNNKTNLETGIQDMYNYYLNNLEYNHNPTFLR